MKKIIPIAILIIINLPVFSQCEDCAYKENILWIVLDKKSPILHNKINFKQNTKLIKTLSKFKCSNFIEVFPFSKDEYLQRIYKIVFKGDINNLVKELKYNYKHDISKIIKIPKDENLKTYEPSDYMWHLTNTNPTGWLWHLKNIKADLAWDITHGDTSVHVAILDTWFDINHPDLRNKIYPYFDPFDKTVYSSSCEKENHGTIVSSFVASETNGGGQLASVGFNCKLICYQAWAGDYLERAHHASLVMKADVITSSAGGWRCKNRNNWSNMSGIDTIEMLVVKEILNNKTIIVMPAGNGPSGTRCRKIGDTIDSPWFPLHPYYDDRIIIVSSTDKNDKHTYINKLGEDNTHSFFPEVDICAPGYDIMGATGTKHDTCENTVCCVPKPWPYYGFCTGTSFATPIVAGVCALMKSVNPCITPYEVQEIIKLTADPIKDEYLYSGMVGAGRINAYKAVKEASIKYVQNENLIGLRSISSKYSIKAGKNVTNRMPKGNVVIKSSGSVVFRARKEVYLDKGFEVEKGATFSIYVSPESEYSCVEFEVK